MRARRRRRGDDTGFTLVELLVVVVIIGILAVVAIPVLLSAQRSARSSNPMSDVANLKTAVASALTSSEGQPVTTTTSWTSLAAMPASLTSGGATFSGKTAKLRYVPGSDSAFCLEGTSSDGDVFAATTSRGVARGTCSSAGEFVAG